MCMILILKPLFMVRSICETCATDKEEDIPVIKINSAQTFIIIGSHQSSMFKLLIADR